MRWAASRRGDASDGARRGMQSTRRWAGDSSGLGQQWQAVACHHREAEAAELVPLVSMG